MNDDSWPLPIRRGVADFFSRLETDGRRIGGLGNLDIGVFREPCAMSPTSQRVQSIALIAWSNSATFRLAPTRITPTPSAPSTPPPSLKAAAFRKRSNFHTVVFAGIILIIFGIVLKFGWTTAAISPADTRMTEQLQNILDLVRDQRWTTARQAIETYEKSALSDSERQQAADVRTRFEKIRTHAGGTSAGNSRGIGWRRTNHGRAPRSGTGQRTCSGMWLE